MSDAGGGNSVFEPSLRPGFVGNGGLIGLSCASAIWNKNN